MDVQPLYTEDEVAALPSGAVAASAGCGNPTALASLRPGEIVVDLGSGGGIDCFLAAREVGREGRVIGVDMTPDMVELAECNARKMSMDNVEFRLTEIDDTQLDAGSVDVVISNCVINLAVDKAAVFREAFRILRPSGRVYVSDIVSVGGLPDGIESDLDSWAACLGGAEPKAAYLEWLGETGFVEVDVLSESPLRGAEARLDGFRSISVKALKPARGSGAGPGA